MIIGVCGKSGSGKTTFAKKITEVYPNVIHFDIDKYGHKVLEFSEVKQELVNAFGENILNNTSIDRKVLGDLVFSSRNSMKKLNEITWEYMQKEIDKDLLKYKDYDIVLDWLLLPLSKYFNMCDIKILIDVPYEERLKRAMKRDNITEEAFLLRESASIDFKKCDFDYSFTKQNEEFIRKLMIK